MTIRKVLRGVLVVALLLTLVTILSANFNYYCYQFLHCQGDWMCGSTVPPQQIGTCMFKCYWGGWYELFCDPPDGR
jgi:hypothetical protein